MKTLQSFEQFALRKNEIQNLSVLGGDGNNGGGKGGSGSGTGGEDPGKPAPFTGG